MTRLSHARTNETRVFNLASSGASVAQDRLVKSRVVPCPSCGAAVGEGCVTAAGKPTSHPTRRRMALRAERKTSGEYAVADVEFARLTPAAHRRELFRRSGLRRADLAAMLGIADPATITRWHEGTRPAGPEGARYGAWLREQVAHVGERVLDGDAPPVNLSPAPRRARSEPSRLDAGSSCEGCGKWLPGERRLCGKCASDRWGKR